MPSASFKSREIMHQWGNTNINAGPPVVEMKSPFRDLDVFVSSQGQTVRQVLKFRKYVHLPMVVNDGAYRQNNKLQTV
jgi:hypothetical protein